MFFDVEQTYLQTHDSLPRIWSHETKIWELAYADDTVLLSRTLDTLQTFLHLLEDEASLYGMSLNTDKCKLLAINRPDLTDPARTPTIPPICFASGYPVEILMQGDHLSYLGITLSSSTDPAREVTSRLQKGYRIRNALKTFLNHSDLTHLGVEIPGVP